MDKVTPKSGCVPGQSRPRRAAAEEAAGRRHRPHDRRQDRAVDLRRDVRDQVAGRWRGARDRRARQCRGYRPRRHRRRAGLQGLARHAGGDAARSCCIASPTRSRSAPTRSPCSNASTPARRIRFMAKAAIRGAENFRFFADQCAEAPRRPDAAERRALELLDPRADRPGRRDHAVEHAVHALDLEDRAGARGRLHGGAQAGRMVAGHGRPAGEAREARPACPPACSTPCTASARKPARR